jgi:hypothetical protein
MDATTNEINGVLDSYNNNNDDNNVQLLLSILDAHPMDDINGDIGEETGAGPAETYYKESNNNKRVLFAMCVGIVDANGDALVNLDLPPWSTIKKRSEVKPNQKSLYQEMKRRIGESSEGPRGANWPTAKIVDWLMKNPLQSEADLQFLHNETSRFRIVIETAEQSTTAGTEKQWRGSIPYLRIIMSLTEDDIKSEFIKHGRNKTRLELDARNSEVREKTVYELIAERWNDENYNPVVPSFMVHEDFRCQTDCAYEKVKLLSPATGDKVRNVISNMRACLNRIISNWEQSGQGDSGVLPENRLSNQHGNLQNRSPAALDSRASFLGDGYPSYLLVLWEIADSHQILHHTLQRLAVGVGVDNALTTPSVIRRSPHQSTSPLTINPTIGSMLNETMETFADRMANAQIENTRTKEQGRRDSEIFQEKTRINSRLSLLIDMIRATKKEQFRSKNEEEKQFLQQEIDSIEEEMESLNSTLREIGRK